MTPSRRRERSSLVNSSGQDNGISGRSPGAYPKNTESSPRADRTGSAGSFTKRKPLLAPKPTILRPLSRPTTPSGVRPLPRESMAPQQSPSIPIAENSAPDLVQSDKRVPPTESLVPHAPFIKHPRIPVKGLDISVASVNSNTPVDKNPADGIYSAPPTPRAGSTLRSTPPPTTSALPSELGSSSSRHPPTSGNEQRQPSNTDISGDSSLSQSAPSRQDTQQTHPLHLPPSPRYSLSLDLKTTDKHIEHTRSPGLPDPVSTSTDQRDTEKDVPGASAGTSAPPEKTEPQPSSKIVHQALDASAVETP